MPDSVQYVRLTADPTGSQDLQEYRKMTITVSPPNSDIETGMAETRHNYVIVSGPQTMLAGRLTAFVMRR